MNNPSSEDIRKEYEEMLKEHRSRRWSNGLLGLFLIILGIAIAFSGEVRDRVDDSILILVFPIGVGVVTWVIRDWNGSRALRLLGISTSKHSSASRV